MGFGMAPATVPTAGRPRLANSVAKSKSNNMSADADGIFPEDARERELQELEKQDVSGKLTPAERHEKLLPLKLEASLLKLAAAGGGQKVEVRVTLRDLSDATVRKLEDLGFKVLAKATSVKLVIGTIGADKLEALALLDVVRQVEPGES
jgi:hypothetical protein